MKPKCDIDVQTSMTAGSKSLPHCCPTTTPTSFASWLCAILLVLFCLVPLSASDDVVVLTGTIIDSATKEPIAGAAIRAEGRTTGTYTNARGAFRLPLAASTKHLIVRSIGFREKRVSMPKQTENVRIALASAGVSLRGVNVVGDITAEEVIRRAIERRDQNARRIRTIVSQLYSKIRIGFDVDVAASSKQRRQDIILETFSTISERRQPDQRKHVRIDQRRQTANIPAQQNLAVFDEFFDFTMDEITILKTTMVTPLGNEALEQYNYAIVGRSVLDSQTVYELTFAPRSRLFPGFEGRLSIVDGTYQIIATTFAPSQETSFPFLKNLSFEQRYDRVVDSVWVPTYQLTSAEMSINLIDCVISLEAKIAGQTNVSSVDINVPIADSLFVPKQLSREDSIVVAEQANERGGTEIEQPRVRIDVAPAADSLLPEYWSKYAFAEQTAEEARIYARQDSIKKEGGGDDEQENTPLSGSIITLASWGGGTVGLDPVFDYSSITRTIYGASLSTRWDPVRVVAAAGWGSSGTKVGRLSIGGTALRTSSLSLDLSASIFSSLASVQAAKSTQLTFGTVDVVNLLYPRYQDFYRRDGGSVGAQVRWKRFSATVEASSSRHINMPLLDSLERPRVLADPGDYRVLTFTVQGPRPGRLASLFSDRIEPVSGSIHGIVGSELTQDRSFWSLDASVTARLATYRTGYAPMQLDLTLAAGVQSQSTPNQYRFAVLRAFPVFGVLSDMATIPINAFAGTQIVRATAEHNFTDLWWRAIGLPGILFGRGIDLIGVVSTVSTTNGAGAVVPGLAFDSTNGVYMEAGVAVARVPSLLSELLFFRIDARWPVGPMAAKGSFGWILTLTTPFQ